MAPDPVDPPLVSLSLAVYRLLLAAYPAQFRSEYGPWMAQVFRDQCLRAFRSVGPGGLPPLWAHTLLDWLKTIVEQRALKQRALKGAPMTRIMLIRICGWCLVLSAAAVVIGGLSSLLYSGTTDPYNGLYRPFDPLLYLGQRLFIPTFTLLTAAGLVGFYAHYGRVAGWLGRLALAVGALGGLVAFILFAVLSLADQGNEPSGVWDWAMLGLLLMFAGLTVFGAAALRRRAMAGWSWLPLATGSLVLALTTLSLGLFDIMPAILTVLLVSVLTCGLFLLGRLLLRETAVEALPA